jgi:hypothetical protein
MFLKRDITGKASGIEYGKQGDEVLVITNRNEMWLVENKGTRFFVFPDDLSNDKIEKVSQPAEVVSKGAKGVQRLGSKKRYR